jgi:hypothetical protein
MPVAMTQTCNKNDSGYSDSKSFITKLELPVPAAGRRRRRRKRRRRFV